MNRNFRIFLQLICIGLIWFGSPFVRADVLMTTGQYHESINDLTVKVLGGFVRAERTWYEGKWYFNRRWAPIRLHYDATDGSLKRIERNFDLYERANDTGTVFAYARRRTIELTDTGYKWRDRDGNWIDYDQQGRMTAYGDRNNVKVSVAYDSNGNLVSVFDHFGTQVLWYEFDSNGRVIAVRDVTNRRVEYQYTNGLLTTAIDVLGNPWTYQYDSSGRLSKKVDAEGRETTITYTNTGMVRGVFDQENIGISYEYASRDERDRFYVQTRTSGGRLDEYWYDPEGRQVRHDLNGRMIASLSVNGRQQIRVDRFGNTTTVTYDEWDNNIKTVYPDGASITQSFDPRFSNITRRVNENGVVTQNAYDVNGNLIRTTEAFGTPVERVIEYEYDQYGQRLLERRVADAVTAEAVTRFAYDSRGNVITQTDPEGHVTTYALDIQGNELTRTDPRGKVWTNTYDLAGHLLSETSPLPGQTALYEYDKVDNLVKKTNAANKQTSFTYDLRDRITRRTDAYGNSVIYAYSPDGHLIQETDEEDKHTWYEYDHEGRRVKITDSNQNHTTVEYIDENRTGLLLRTRYPTYVEESVFDERERLIEQTKVLIDNSRLTTSYTYDPAGNRTTVIDAKNRLTSYRYDALDRLFKEIDPTSSSVLSTYDSRDNLLSLTDQNGNTHRFTYDRNNRRMSGSLPMGETTSFSYDPAGNLIEKIDAKGQKAVFEYDDAGRRTTTYYYVSINAASADKTVTFSYDIINNLIGYADGTTSAAYGFDDLQRKITESVDYGNFSLGYSYEYYRNSKKSAFTNPEGERYEYRYDDNNQLISVFLPSSGSIDFLDYNWISPGRVSWPGGSVRYYSYDDLMRITKITDRDPNGNIILDYTYTYDEVGNVLEKLTEHGSYSYSYDQLDRLTGVVSPSDNESYQYDPAGNRLGDHNVSGLWEYNANNQLLARGDHSYEYDANGSQTQKSISNVSTFYVHNLENRISKIQDDNGLVVAEYYYDPFGRRLWKEVNGSKKLFIYSDEGMIGEYDVNGTTWIHYGYMPDSMWTTAPLWKYGSGEFYFYHTDHLGTPHLLTNINGNIVWQGRYTAFAEVTEPISIVKNRHRLPGQYFDSETEEHYNFFRFFSPSIGRYLTSDPIGIRGSLNLYAYALNNPIRYIDPLGLKRWNPFGMRDWCLNKPKYDRCMAAVRQQYMEDVSEALRILQVNLRRAQIEFNECFDDCNEDYVIHRSDRELWYCRIKCHTDLYSDVTNARIAYSARLITAAGVYSVGANYCLFSSLEKCPHCKIN